MYYTFRSISNTVPAVQCRQLECHEISFFVPPSLVCHNFQPLMLEHSTLTAN